MKILSPFIRGFVGLLFIFSGLIKINDPVGTAIKLEEYFEVFSVDFLPLFHSFVPFALGIAVFLSVLEVVLGVAVLINYKMRLTASILLALIIFFTFLTFYSAYFNKVTDCGCFGDAIKLTPWQSFIKDLILLVMIVFLFINRNKYISAFNQVTGNVLMATVLVFHTGLAIYAIEHLPYIDFRAYKVGADLPSLMKPSDTYRYRYVMIKDGKEVNMDSYPTEEGYEFKEMILLNPEAQPKITDYSVWTDEGDFTAETFEGIKLAILINDVKKANKKSMQAINNLIANLENTNIIPIVLTASDETSFENFRHEVQLAAPFYFADGTVLKTISRSNPGIILLQDGVVKGKWHYNDVPEVADIKTLIQ
ncbi:MAG: DoxX family protein [Bacteroidota bacterium]|nr:DoxX family protein [Bacteroidota bacterium]